MERVKQPSLLGEVCAEFAGTLILILIGVGVVAQVVAQGNGGADSIHWAWGLGVVLGVYTAARISGAHINPAVTLALAVFRGFPWRKVLPYSAAQTAGAFVAALLVRWNYREGINATDPDTTFATQGIFSTLPGPNMGIGGTFRDEVIGTAILLFLVLAVTDARNTAPMANMAPFIIGLIVVAIGFAWGVNSGYAINPARDFGPRLASWLTGYETAWREPGGSLYFWVPIVAPLVGALIGAALYDLLIGRFLPLPAEEQEVGRVPTDAPETVAESGVPAGRDPRVEPTSPEHRTERNSSHG